MRRLAALAIVAAWALAGQAAAQTSVQRSWTTFVVHGIEPPKGELAAAPDTALLAQPVTATRAAQLDVEAPTAETMGSAKTFPAGTKMFGVKVPDGWIYCAVAPSTVKWLFVDWTVCYQDTDQDGAFEFSRSSGAPFNGIPLFVLQPGPPKRLATPLKYTMLPYAEGPQTQFAFVWKPVVKKVKKGEPPAPITQYTITPMMVAGETRASVGRAMTYTLGDAPRTFRQDGASITVLGLNPDNTLRYRVDSVMPSQIQPLEMVLTTSTYYYVVSY